MDHALSNCPKCGAAEAYCANWTGTETIIWKCGTWKDDGRKLFEQSLACRIRELEQRVSELERENQDAGRRQSEPLGGAG